jgi:hypothetical protein
MNEVGPALRSAGFFIIGTCGRSGSKQLPGNMPSNERRLKLRGEFDDGCSIFQEPVG